MLLHPYEAIANLTLVFLWFALRNGMDGGRSILPGSLPPG